MLKTETNTQRMKVRVLKAARKYFRKRKGVSVVFEHGQWWVCLENGAQYSVVDAYGGNSVGGFSFEEVTPASE